MVTKAGFRAFLMRICATVAMNVTAMTAGIAANQMIKAVMLGSEIAIVALSQEQSCPRGCRVLGDFSSEAWIGRISRLIW